jgi:NitT/TauT family transport system substrate-binding protein
MRTSQSVAVLAAGVLALSACSGDAEGGETAGGGDLRQLTVAVANPSAVAYFPLYTAIEQGFFEDEGLSVEVQAVDGSSATLQALATGQADIASPAPGPLLTAREQGQEAVMFYNLTANNIFSLVVPEESGIGGVDELTGAVIGVGTADGAEVALARNILSDAGLTEDTDYEFLTVGDGGLATAGFERGDIDAYAATIVDVAIIEARGIALDNLTPDDYRAQMSNGLAATAEFIEAEPEVVEGFGRAVARGFTWGAENKDEALKITAEVSPEEGSDEELSAALFDVVVEYGTPIEGDDLGFSPAEGWEAWARDLVESGQLDEEPDLEKAYTNDFVDAFNDF